MLHVFIDVNEHDRLLEALETGLWTTYAPETLAYEGIMRQVRQVWSPNLLFRVIDQCPSPDLQSAQRIAAAEIKFLFHPGTNLLLIIENNIPVPLVFKVKGSCVYLWRIYSKRFWEVWSWWADWELRLGVEQQLAKISEVCEDCQDSEICVTEKE